MTEEFKVLTDREHAIARSGVYIGSTTLEPHSGIIDWKWQAKNVVPGLLKIVDEIVQNSVDENTRTNGKFADEITVSIEDTVHGTQITVSDNGRGIPQEVINGKPRPVWAWTELRAGSNFDDSKRITAGTNGMGAALTNIFSTSFEGVTADGKQKLRLTCSDNMSKVSFNQAKSKDRGTTVSFIPDLSKFGLTEFTQDHIDVIRDRLINLSIMYPNIKFKFGKEKLGFRNIKQIAKNFHENAVAVEEGDISLVFAPSGEDEEFRCHSYVNGIYVKQGGTHVDVILHKISETLRTQIKKKHKIEVSPNQIRQHLLFASWIRNFNGLKFDSQTKERITNSWAEVGKKVDFLDFETIAKRIMGTADIIDPMIAAILYKKEMQERRELAAKQRATAKIRVVNHIAATDPNPENRTLCIAEGLSAIGPLIAVRDPKKIGGYPLKGKIMNVRGMRPLEIMKNKEISEMMSILGLTFGAKAENMNYGKIAVCTDADVDGSSIFCLLLNLFSHWPELFHEGRISRMIAPLYDCRKGKSVKLFYTTEEFNKFDSTGWTVNYYKGLGSMPKEVYKEFVNNPFMVTVTAEDIQDFAALQMAFGDDSGPRKEWLLG